MTPVGARPRELCRPEYSSVGSAQHGCCPCVWAVLTGPVLMQCACSLQSPFLPSAQRSMGSQT